MAEDTWKDIRPIVTKNIHHKTNAKQSETATKQTPPIKKLNDEHLPAKESNEVNYEDLDQNNNLADQPSLFDWSNDSFWNRDFTATTTYKPIKVKSKANILPQYLENKADIEEDIWRNISLLVTTDIHNETNAVQS